MGESEALSFHSAASNNRFTDSVQTNCQLVEMQRFPKRGGVSSKTSPVLLIPLVFHLSIHKFCILYSLPQNEDIDAYLTGRRQALSPRLVNCLVELRLEHIPFS